MPSPAAVLAIAVTANTAQANAALARTQANLSRTATKANASGAVMKKALVGVGVAAGAAGYALFKIGEDFDASYDKIRTQTGATGKEMRKLKDSFRTVVQGVPADFDTVASALAGVRQRLDLTGKPLEKMTRQLVQLSKITNTDVEDNVRSVSRAFVDWEVKTKDQSKTLDGFFRLSQKTGVSVADIAESVQKFGSPLRQLGFDLDTAAAMFANFEKAGVNTQTMVPGLKLALATLNEPTSTAAEEMEKFNITIGNAPKGLREVFKVLGNDNVKAVDRISLAMAVFGKRAGADMKEAIEQGRFEVDKLLDVMKNGKGTIDKAERSTRDFDEQWQIFKNRTMVALEPLATKVFGAIGDQMQRISRIMGDKTLTGQEKFNAILQVVQDNFEKALDKAAEYGPKIAGALLRGIANAWWDSNILGKLLLTGAFIRLVGGRGALAKVGLAMGGILGRQIGLGARTGIISQMGLASGAAGAGGTTLFGSLRGKFKAMSPRLRTLGKVGIGLAIGGGVLLGIKEAIEGGGETNFGEDIRSRIKELFPLDAMTGFGDSGTSNVVMEWGSRLEKTKKMLDAFFGSVEQGWKKTDLRKWYAETIFDAKRLGLVTEREFERITESIGLATKKYPRLASEMSQTTKSGVRDHRKLRDSLSENEKASGRQAVKWSKDNFDIRKSTDETRKKASGDLHKLSKDGSGSFRDLGKAGKDKTSDMASKVAGTVSNMVSAVVGKGGFSALIKSANDALGALKVKDKLSYKPTAPSSAEVAALHRARGGPIPGAGSGDKVPAMLEPGEYVLNKNLTQAIGRPTLDLWNHNMVPRMASGGMAGLKPGISRLAQFAMDRYGLAISSGLRSGTGSFHNTGEAVDLVPPSMKATQGIFGAFKNQLEELFYDPWGGWDSGQMIGPIGGHMDHIHAAILGAGTGGPLAQKIKRIILNGPDGPLKNMGQSALDRVRSAANTYVRRNSVAAPHTGGGAMSLGDIAQLWSSVNGGLGDANLMARIAMAESSGNPAAIGHDPGGTRGLGLWQITTGFNDDIIRRFGGESAMLTPVPNAKAAAAILQRQGIGAWAASSGNWQQGGMIPWFSKGADFIANAPMLMGVGDGGPERVSVMPLAGGGGWDGGYGEVYVEPPQVHVYVSGTGVDYDEITHEIEETVSEAFSHQNQLGRMR